MFSKSRRDSGISLGETPTESGVSGTTRRPPQRVSSFSPSLRGSPSPSGRPLASPPERLTSEKGQTFTQTSTQTSKPPASSRLPISRFFDLRTSRDRTIAPPRIEVPDDVIPITFPGSRRTFFTTTKAEKRIRLKKVDCEAKVEIALRRAETRSAETSSVLHKEWEEGEGALELTECLLMKLAVQENTLRGLSGEATMNKEMGNQREEEANLERMKRETVEVLSIQGVAGMQDEASAAAGTAGKQGQRECSRTVSGPWVAAHVARSRNVLKRTRAQDMGGGVQSQRPRKLARASAGKSSLPTSAQPSELVVISDSEPEPEGDEGHKPRHFLVANSHRTERI
ncbi:uncharacterized protein PAC_18283 [Phialocephala subalpina]|uniref:Uncharacterized protein n=1 Tax=Phialocephala subalpina TaxID=576137 RepID=A0A1L7XTM1_9HELO|nr:uncharacterized protein PAC_18283 [Phialocephala subalpina]